MKNIMMIILALTAVAVGLMFEGVPTLPVMLSFFGGLVAGAACEHLLTREDKTSVTNAAELLQMERDRLSAALKDSQAAYTDTIRRLQERTMERDHWLDRAVTVMAARKDNPDALEAAFRDMVRRKGDLNPRTPDAP